MSRATVINSLARGLHILRLLADGAAPFGVTEVAEQLEVDPSTAYRLLATLQAQGFVAQDADSKKYTIGYGVLAIAGSIQRRLSVIEIARQYLRDVATKTGENAHVAIRDRACAVSIDSESATGILRVETTIGTPEPLYCTAVGKALLIDFSPEALHEIFGNASLKRYTAQTITNLDDLQADLARARRLGYAFDDEELHPGVKCIASPLRDHTGRVIAAFGISAPSVRLSRERVPDVASMIVSNAHAISALLGFAHPAAAAV